MFVGAAFALTWGVMLGYLLHLRRVRQRAQELVDGVTSAGTR